MKDSAGVSLLVYGTKQKILFVLCGGGWGVAMAIQVSLGILLNEISEEWGVTYIEQSLIPICTMLGVFFGSYFWGIFADKYGRKHAFRSVLFFIFFGIAIGICSPNIWMLAPCYVITGFGIGGSFTVDGNVFLEYCPHEKQYLLTGISILSAFGASVPPGIAWLYSSLDLPYQWRFVQGTLGLIALLLIVPRFWIEETPTFLISKRKATAVYNLIKDINPDEDEELLRSRILEASPTISAEENGLGKQLKILLRKPLKKYTILYFFIWFGTAFTFNGLGNFLPVLLKRAGFGQTDSDIYRTMLFQQLGKK